MAWIEPKTDWVATDRFNIDDYNRIKNNLNHLHGMAEELNRQFQIGDMGDDIDSYSSYWEVAKFNLFESNLETINQNMFTKDYGNTMTFYENGLFITWQELNRIEKAISSMYEILENQRNGLRKLPFKLGRFKEVRV